MNIWAKMMTALRGGVSEAGEAVVDSQALRILDQEVRDAAEQLTHSKQSLAEIIARQKLAKEKCATLEQSIGKHESYAIKALAQGDEALAREVAEKIAALENQLQTENETASHFLESSDSLRSAINQTESNLRRLKHQVDTVKATENVQRAQEAVAKRHHGSNSKMHTAMESLERIKEKQALKAATMSAANELADCTEDTTLHSKLEKAGIVSNGTQAEDILTRLRQKSSK